MGRLGQDGGSGVARLGHEQRQRERAARTPKPKKITMRYTTGVDRYREIKRRLQKGPSSCCCFVLGTGGRLSAGAPPSSMAVWAGQPEILDGP